MDTKWITRTQGTITAVNANVPTICVVELCYDGRGGFRFGAAANTPAASPVGIFTLYPIPRNWTPTQPADITWLKQRTLAVNQSVGFSSDTYDVILTSPRNAGPGRYGIWYTNRLGPAGTISWWCDTWGDK